MTVDQTTSAFADDNSAQDDSEPSFSLPRALRNLTASAREFVDAELGLLRARGSIVGVSSAMIAGFGIAALIFLLASIITLMIGLVLALLPHVGLGFSLLIVVGAGLLLVASFALLILAQIRRIKAALS